MINLCDVPDGHVFRTQSGRWFKHRSNGRCGNEFGHPARYYDGSPVGPITDIRPDWPYISEYELFRLQRPPHIPRTVFHNRILPNTCVIFETDVGYRQLVELKDYKVRIPFWFDTIDPRVPRAQAEWTASSGQIWRHLVDQPLSLRWEQDRILLHAGLHGELIIPTER